MEQIRVKFFQTTGLKIIADFWDFIATETTFLHELPNMERYVITMYRLHELHI